MELEDERRILKVPQYTNLTIVQLFKLCSAYWVYSGNQGEPHALLTSGLHSNGYFNVSEVLKYPNLRRILACRLAAQLEAAGINKEDTDLIVSSSYAAFPFGQAISDAMGIPSVYTEKDDQAQKWTGRFSISKGARILQIEELLTTLGTTIHVRDAVLRGERNPFEFVKKDGKIAVATIIHRPTNIPTKYYSHHVIALHEAEIHNWKPEECPLCKAGSEALKPKANWAKFALFV